MQLRPMHIAAHQWRNEILPQKRLPTADEQPARTTAITGKGLEIYTIGHSNHTSDVFVHLLKQHEIQLLVDVRSKPVSRFAAFANKKTLPGLLEREGIRHIFMGNSLGGKPTDPSLQDSDGKPDYVKMRSTDAFQEGISRLIELAKDASVALMCAEEDPSKCHRRLLIGPALEESGVRPLHIRADVSIQGVP
jgi:uncharacterized protein (DUF488 family)